MKKKELENEKKLKAKPRRVSFSLGAEEYDMFEVESLCVGFEKPGYYAKWVVQNRKEVKLISSESIIDSTRKVGKAVDLAKAKLQEAGRDPDAWKYEVDMDIIRDLLEEVRRVQTELVKNVINNLRR